MSYKSDVNIPEGYTIRSVAASDRTREYFRVNTPAGNGVSFYEDGKEMLVEFTNEHGEPTQIRIQ